jgi:hypothetical protein
MEKGLIVIIALWVLIVELTAYHGINKNEARLNALEAAITCAQQPQKRHYQCGDTVVWHGSTLTFDSGNFYVFKR